MDYPRTLITNDQADATSLTPFAIGRLVLWTTNPRIKLADPMTALTNSRVRHIAIAHLQTAPYGRAALQALAKLNLTSKLRPKFVIGENISQAAQFVASGNADLGFVAMSLVLAPQLKDSGQWIEVPAAWHTPIIQGAVITKQGVANPASRKFLAFLQAPVARKIIAGFGYHVPAHP
jgi:molybdate transport system substrate-binding protein